jgi:hypothetical protein
MLADRTVAPAGPVFTCPTSNPCARNAAGALTGQGCCISVSTDGSACGRGAGNPIKFFASATCNPP